MQKIFVLVILIILVFLFALPSASQSYASARQAQAVIETSRVAQIASTGNLVIITMLSILLLAALGVIGYLLWRARQQPANPRWVSGPNARWGQMPTADTNALLPALMAALVVQMLNHQQPNRAEPDQLFRPRYEIEQPADDDPTWDEIPWTIQ